MSIGSAGKESVKSVPEFFYDVLAYILPGILLIGGAVLVSTPVNSALLGTWAKVTVTLDKTVLLAVGVCLVYVLGQSLTFVSYFVVLGLLGGVARLAKMKSWRYHEDRGAYFPWQEGFDRDWTPDFVKIRALRPGIGLEVTKRYARLILARNMTLVLLLLCILSESARTGWSLSPICLLFWAETMTRRSWFITYIQESVKPLDALKKRGA